MYLQIGLLMKFMKENNMKKLSKLFLAMILAFTSIVVFNPNETKAQEASTYAMGTNVPVYYVSDLIPFESNGVNIQYKYTISGTYYLTGTTVSNISVGATYQTFPSSSVLKPFTKNCSTVKSGNYVVTTLKVGYKYNSKDIGVYNTYTHRFLIP